MIDRAALLADLRGRLRLLERDLASRMEEAPAMAAALEAEYRDARAAGRTADPFSVWRAGQVTGAAVAWLLGCVFVRFVEDNRLVEAPLIGGPDGRTARAVERQRGYFRERPTDTDRDYLLDVFAAVARLPALAGLYDRQRNPVWRLGISGDAARDLLAFWRAVDADTGTLRHDFTDPDWDSRFLGDLYQDLSDDARKRYALLQTPEFVEEFILDRTLDPAIDEFGLAGIRLIDPACGSGHFLLGAFDRVLRAWFIREPGTPERVLVQRALDSVHGVDVNPFAVAIARFRLLIAALRASRVDRLADAPAFTIHVAAGDSLLHGRRFGELDPDSDAERMAVHDGFGHAFRTEDLGAVNRILGRRYHVVVGNPPYVTVRDKAVNTLYRARYATCYRQYSLAVPFTERCFDLAQSGGYVGLITANSFMKREFGKRLVEWLARLDLTHVIDTSGAYVPGHGTPTVILFGRHRPPVAGVVRAVMGIRGEPATPDDPARGHVWSALVEQVDLAKSESEWVSSEDVARATFSVHPWSVRGGGTRTLQESLEAAATERLGDVSAEIGRTSHTGEDDAFHVPIGGAANRRLERHAVPLVIGENVRDWMLHPTHLSLFPYEGPESSPWTTIPRSIEQHFWRLRTRLRARQDYGEYIEARGLRWFEHSMFFRRRFRVPLSIAFAFVATHNHFVLSHGGMVFNRSAPVIKLSRDATVAAHLALVGLLNSSVACFWIRQVCHSKGGPGEKWSDRYEVSATKIGDFPLPTERPVGLAQALDRLAAERQAHLPAQLAASFPLSPTELDRHRDTAARLLARMIALQEEMDWQCYRLYGVISKDDCRYVDHAGERRAPPSLALGERAFEIVMARRLAAGEIDTQWFTRHGSTPITTLPAHWPADYRATVRRRVALIESDRFVGLLERPEYKRRWNVEPWPDQERRALRSWLLDRLESAAYWPEPRLSTVAKMAERAAADADLQRVAARYAGNAAVDTARLVAELVEAESVPALPVQRYSRSGLVKRADWEATWAAQRREDAIAAEAAATPRDDRDTETDQPSAAPASGDGGAQDETEAPPPPPKYRAADFQKPGYWRLRGPLDVPKERFVSLPGMSRDRDPSLLVGWAGWDALTLCHAVAAWYTEVTEQDGWSAARRTPLLAILHEHLPWLKQWHNDLDPEYHQRLGDFYETFLHSELAASGLTVRDLRTWVPPKTAGRRTRRMR